MGNQAARAEEPETGLRKHSACSLVLLFRCFCSVHLSHCFLCKSCCFYCHFPLFYFQWPMSNSGRILLILCYIFAKIESFNHKQSYGYIYKMNSHSSKPLKAPSQKVKCWWIHYLMPKKLFTDSYLIKCMLNKNVFLRFFIIISIIYKNSEDVCTFTDAFK